MIKVITGPRVKIISRQEFIDHPNYPIPEDGTDDIRLGAFAAKGCYDSFGVDGRANSKNQEAILEHRHGSVLEHIHAGLWIEGITRGLSLELNRHRTFNISQRSTRYTAEEESAIVLDPYFSDLFVAHKPSWTGYEFISSYNIMTLPDRSGVTETRLLINHLNTQVKSIRSYSEQVDQLVALNPNNLTGFDLRKWARGKARNVLPHGIETRGTWTNNLRGWRWFIEARSTRHAEPEIRRLADCVLKVLHEEYPLYFNDFYDNVEVVDGIPEYTPKYSKV